MSTSADERGAVSRLRDASAVTLQARPYDDPLSQQLIEAVQQEYVQRYGGRDEAVVDPADFRPPDGAFFVAQVDGRPAGCGAWRSMDPTTAEIKRVYVEPSFRRLGLAQAIVRTVEASAAQAGHRAMVLNSGSRQPEALTLYVELGYRPIAGYGIYADASDAVFLGVALHSPEEDRPWAS